MALLLGNAEVRESLDAKGYVEAMEEVFKEFGKGAAVNCPRTETSIPITKHPASRMLAAQVRKKIREFPDDGDPRYSAATIRAAKRSDEVIYRLKTMLGGYPRRGIMALRIDSTIDTHPLVDGVRKNVEVKLPLGPDWQYTGMVMLFSLATGEVLGILAEGVLQQMRVAATSALGVKYLSRKDAANVGLFGTSWQAEGQLETAAQVRRLGRVRVYSPSPEHRRRFAALMEKRTGVEVLPMDRPQDVFQEADIVLCATSSFSPVFSARWLRPGMHLGTVNLFECDPKAFDVCDRVAVNVRPFGGPGFVHDFVMGGGQKSMTVGRLINRSARNVDWRKVVELGTLLNGKSRGRRHSDDITFHANNIGLGMQFAAAGARILENARKRGLGREIPTDWFLQKEHT
jgi:ornithine cyclodeaminase/alanine dehydrogenase-like protein (mu-crystallin family)